MKRERDETTIDDTDDVTTTAEPLFVDELVEKQLILKTSISALKYFTPPPGKHATTAEILSKAHAHFHASGEPPPFDVLPPKELDLLVDAAHVLRREVWVVFRSHALHLKVEKGQKYEPKKSGKTLQMRGIAWSIRYYQILGSHCSAKLLLASEGCTYPDLRVLIVKPTVRQLQPLEFGIQNAPLMRVSHQSVAIGKQEDVGLAARSIWQLSWKK